MQRRLVDTARCGDCLHWERLAGRALEFPPPYNPVPGLPVYHVSVGDQVILVADQDLSGPLLNLVTAVMALGEELSTLSPAVGAAGDNQGERHRKHEHADRQDRQEAETGKQPGNRPGKDPGARAAGPPP
jgi:hypothetical protein